MTKEVLLEMRIRGGDWKRLGGNSENEPPGSISNNESSGRQIYMFGWHDNEGPAVWRSQGGFEIENKLARELHTTGLEKLADLDKGPFQMNWQRTGVSVPIRFRVVTA